MIIAGDHRRFPGYIIRCFTYFFRLQKREGKVFIKCLYRKNNQSRRL